MTTASARPANCLRSSRSPRNATARSTVVAGKRLTSAPTTASSPSSVDQRKSPFAVMSSAPPTTAIERTDGAGLPGRVTIAARTSIATDVSRAASSGTAAAITALSGLTSRLGLSASPWSSRTSPKRKQRPGHVGRQGDGDNDGLPRSRPTENVSDTERAGCRQGKKGWHWRQRRAPAALSTHGPFASLPRRGPTTGAPWPTTPASTTHHQ